MEVTNPATEESTTIEETPIAAIAEIVEKAKTAQTVWAAKSITARVIALEPLGKLLTQHAAEFAQTISSDMGKPIKKAQAEIARAVDKFGYFLEKAPLWLAPEELEGASVRYNPLGVVAVISPWNFPLFVSMNNIVPALLAGNSVVYKPSENAIQTGKLIVQLFAELDLVPKNLIQIVVGAKEHGKELVRQDVAMVSLVGSTAAGKDILKTSADRVRNTLLELGGLDAAIVLKDADITNAAKKLVGQNTFNTGQICCSVKRVYVEKEIFDEFLQTACEISKGITFGNPAEDVDMGPLVSKIQLDKVNSIVEDAKKKGAKVHSGGEVPKQKGYFYPSTILTNVSSEMRLLQEEPFGPILPIIPVDSWEEGVKQANKSQYGLTGSVWTTNIERGKEIAAKLEVGVASVNTHGAAPRGTPWGGAKESGLGRNGYREGIRQFTNIQTLHVGS